MIKVYVVNRLTHMCDVLTAVVNTIGGYEVVGTFASGRELLNNVFLDQPDICILDVRLSDVDGFGVLKLLNEVAPVIKVIVLTEHVHPYTVKYMIKYGALAFLPINSDCVEIREAIETVAQGEYYFTDVVSRSLIDDIRTYKVKVLDVTPRQQEFIQYCFRDFTYREMAGRMGVSRHTMEYFRECLQRNHGLRGRGDFILFGVQTGLVRIDGDCVNQLETL